MSKALWEGKSNGVGIEYGPGAYIVGQCFQCEGPRRYIGVRMGTQHTHMPSSDSLRDFSAFQPGRRYDSSRIGSFESLAEAHHHRVCAIVVGQVGFTNGDCMRVKRMDVGRESSKK